MATIARQATVSFSDIDLRNMSSASSLEDQSRAVWKAAQKTLALAGASKRMHNGKPGIQGEMVMKRVVNGLFSQASLAEKDRIATLTGQVLRKLNAAVCTRRPENGKDTTPTWWISDELSDDIAVVALWVQNRSTGVGSENLPEPGGPGPIETAQAADGHRKDWISDKELGHDRPPSPVMVTRTEAQQAASQSMGDTIRELHKARVDAVLDIVAASAHQPLTVEEIASITPQFPRSKTGANPSSSVRDILRELVAMDLVYERKSTPDEHRLRLFPNVPKARRPVIFSTINPVPARTVQTPVALGGTSNEPETPVRKERVWNGPKTPARTTRKAVVNTSRPVNKAAPTPSSSHPEFRESGYASVRKLDRERRSRVIEFLTAEPDRRFQLQEISAVIGVNGHSSTRRVMWPLVKNGQVIYSHGRYSIAPAPEVTPATVTPPGWPGGPTAAGSLAEQIEQLILSAAGEDQSARIAELETEVARLRRANAGLTAALGAMQEG